MTRYRALRPLYYRTDPAAIKRAKSGDAVPFSESRMRDCKAGSFPDDLAKESIPVLLKKKWIEAVEDPPEHKPASVAAPAGGGEHGNRH